MKGPFPWGHAQSACSPLQSAPRLGPRTESGACIRGGYTS